MIENSTATAKIGLVNGINLTDQELAGFFPWLSPNEARRYHRFARPQRQRQFFIGRLLLRYMLGEQLGIAPEMVKLIEQPGNAPLLDKQGSARVGFSLSHSGSWVACAVSADTALGLDIEVMDPGRDFEALSEQAFEADDIAYYNAQPDEFRVAAFYQLWSRNEARYKLTSTCGLTSGASCITLPHSEISIVLCSEIPLVPMPICEFFEFGSRGANILD